MMANPAQRMALARSRRHSSTSSTSDASDDEPANADQRAYANASAIRQTVAAVAAAATAASSSNARVSLPRPYTNSVLHTSQLSPATASAFRPLSNGVGNRPQSATSDSLQEAYQKAAALEPSLRSVEVGLLNTGASAALEAHRIASPGPEFKPYQAIVIDNGSAMLRAGFAGETAPRLVVPNIIGRPVLDRYGRVGSRLGGGDKRWSARSGRAWSERANATSDDERHTYIGAQALELEGGSRGALAIKYPVQNGVIKNWDDMEEIWEYVIFSELVTTPQVHDVLVTDASSQNRMKMAEFFFETCLCEGFQTALPAALVAYDRQTALVLDCGHGICSATPVCDWSVNRHQVQRSFVAGRTVTELLAKLLHERGYDMSSTADLEYVREIKERFAYVSLDPDAERKLAIETKYRELARTFELSTENPDKNVVLDVERFECTEPLFVPSLLGRDVPGAHELVALALDTCAPRRRGTLLENVLVTGGCARLPGFVERLRQELDILFPENAGRTRVDTVDESAAWFGGATFAMSAMFEQKWVRREEYDEFGLEGALERKLPFGSAYKGSGE